MEGIIVGFTIGWLITQFLHSGIVVHGIVVRIVFSLVYSLQFLGIALATYCMRNIAVYVMVFPLAIAATTLELIQALLGLTWAVTNPILAIAPTPIAQWSGTFTPFGLSFVSYCLAFSMVPDNAETKTKCLVWWTGGRKLRDCPANEIHFDACSTTF